MTQDPSMAQARPGPASVRSADMRRDYATTFLTEVLVIAAYLVAFRLVAVHFGQSGFGEYALSRRTLSLISPLAVVGVDVAIARYVAYALAQRTGKERGYAGAALLIMAVTVTAVSAALLVFQDFFANLFFGSTAYRDLIAPLPVMLIGSGLHVVAYGYLRGRSLIQRANILMALNQVVIPLTAVYIAQDVSEILLLMGTGWMVVSSAYLVATRFSTGDLRDRSSELLKFGLPRVPGDFLQLALFALPGILVAHLVDIQTAGIVAFGIAALGMVGTALTPISFVLLPAVSGHFARGSVKQVRQQVLAIARVALPVLAAAIIVLELFAPPIIAVYLGPEFAPGADVLRVIMLGALPWGVYVILKSVIDARYVRPINARNLFLAFVVFVAGVFGFRAVGMPPIGTVEAFVISLYVLAALTVLGVVRIFRNERLTDQPDAAAEPARS